MRTFISALFTALIALAPMAAHADSQPTDITTACGLAANGMAGAQLFGVGTLSEFATVNKATGAAHTFGPSDCGAAVIRSNSGTAMTDPLPAPAAGYKTHVSNADSTATDTLSTPSGVIHFGASSASTFALTPGQAADLVSDGVDYYVLNGSTGTGGGIASVFGRTSPAITAQAGDYSVAQVTGAAPLASPALTGTPTAPTAAQGSNNTTLATTAYADRIFSATQPGSVPPSGGTSTSLFLNQAGSFSAPSVSLSANQTWTGTNTFGPTIATLATAQTASFTTSAAQCGETVPITATGAITVTLLSTQPAGCYTRSRGL
jgi:hypothetical protein